MKILTLFFFIEWKNYLKVYKACVRLPAKDWVEFIIDLVFFINELVIATFKNEIRIRFTVEVQRVKINRL